MTPALSVYLDFLRVAATLVVVISHFASPVYTDGALAGLYSWSPGSDAVAVFFVLSGFVIAFCADQKDRTLGAFAASRATRILSVAVPALAMSLLLDLGGRHLHPGLYGHLTSVDQGCWRAALSGLTMTNEWLGQGVQIGSNTPYWSLSYEVGFYLIFAAAFYLKGKMRIAAVIGLSVAVGPLVLALAPSWALGAWCYRYLRRAPVPRRHMAWMLAGLPILAYFGAEVSGLPDWLESATQAALPGVELRFSDQFIWHAAIGVMTVAHVIGMAGLLAGREALRFAVTVQWLAGASFSVYIVHYPAMRFFEALTDRHQTVGLQPGIVLMLTLAFSMAFAQVFERRLSVFRALCRTGYRVLRSGLWPKHVGQGNALDRDRTAMTGRVG